MPSCSMVLLEISTKFIYMVRRESTWIWTEAGLDFDCQFSLWTRWWVRAAPATPRLSRAILVISSSSCNPGGAGQEDHQGENDLQVLTKPGLTRLCSVIIHSVLSYREAIRNYNNYADNEGSPDQVLLADLPQLDWHPADWNLQGSISQFSHPSCLGVEKEWCSWRHLDWSNPSRDLEILHW